jgi:hypothetical protein
MRAARVTQSRMWLEAIAATVVLVLGVITLFWRDWIEFVFRIDPDRHDGSAEWLLIGALFVIAISLSALARRDWRRLCRASVAAL